MGIRGGVSIGLAHHDEYNAFGPAINDAYMLESKEAKFFRIILTSQTLSSGVAISINHKYLWMLDYWNDVLKSQSSN